MRWYLLLIWAQGLRQAPLPVSGFSRHPKGPSTKQPGFMSKDTVPSTELAAGRESKTEVLADQACVRGAVSGRITTSGNVSAEEGGSVTLQCHLPSTTAKVTQINWEQRDQLLAVRHAHLGWHIYPGFRERVAPGPNLGLTLQSLTRNDTGEYFCTYHTYPDGIYRGTVFLEVLQSSVAERSAAFQIPLLGATATVLAVICVAVVMVVALTKKKKSRQVHCAESGLRTVAHEQEEWNARILSSPGSGSQAGTTPVGCYLEQRGDACAEPHDYFNVLSYRSLRSFSFLAETV